MTYDICKDDKFTNPLKQHDEITVQIADIISKTYRYCDMQIRFKIQKP